MSLQRFTARIIRAGVNLLKYFAKHLGCRLAGDNWAFPRGFASLLAADDLLISLFEVSLARNPEIGDLPVRGAGVLANFPLVGSYSPSTGKFNIPTFQAPSLAIWMSYTIRL